MNFEKWINTQGGVEKLAKKINMTPSSVRNWLMGSCSPTLPLAYKLIKMGKGKFNLDDLMALRKITTKNS